MREERKREAGSKRVMVRVSLERRQGTGERQAATADRIDASLLEHPLPCRPPNTQRGLLYDFRDREGGEGVWEGEP